jgi:hypothetical protein
MRRTITGLTAVDEQHDPVFNCLCLHISDEKKREPFGLATILIIPPLSPIRFFAAEPAF